MKDPQKKESLTDYDSTSNEIDRDHKSLDDLIKERLSADPITNVDDEGWEAMSALLDNHDNRHKTVLIAKAIELTALLIVVMLYGSIFQPFADLQQRMESPVLMAASPRQIEVIDNVSRQLLPEGRIDHLPLRISHYIAHVQAAPIKPILRKAFTASTLKGASPSTPTVATLALPTSDIRGLAITPRAIVSIGDQPILELADTQKKSPRKKLLLGAHASVNNDIIFTPDDPIYNGVNGYVHYAEGLSVGIDLAWRLRRVDIRTGLTYIRQKYDPRTISETNRQSSTVVATKRLNDIAFTIANIPLAVDYHVIDKPSWSLLLRGGVGANLVVHAQYDIQEETQLKDKRITRSIAVTDGENIDGSFQLAQKDFHAGLIDGGRLSDNFYLTAMAGIGLELRPSPTLAVQLHTVYNHNLSTALGPNEDRVNSLGFSIGLLKSI